MGAETPHGLGFSGEARAGDLIQALGLDQSKGHLSVQQGILGQVDSLLTSLSLEALDLVPAVGEGGRLI